ncbi:MAG: DUF2971 domain-containing protein [Parvularculaceae bacterium]
MQTDEIEKLFFSHTLHRRNALRNGKRLVHYTRAESAYKIITGKQVWLRNAQLMNDFSEIQHGINCLTKAWDSQTGKSLQNLLDRIKPGLRDELAALFDGHAADLRLATYIFSLSEHEDGEDRLGRLSMWRAYGGRTGVALVLNSTVFNSDTDAMKVFSSPVFYHDPQSFENWFQDWADNIIAAEQTIHSLGADEVRDWLFAAFRLFVLCTKHPAFAEEKEWRVFHSPIHEGQSDWVGQGTEVVNGAPEILMKLDLKDDPERNIVGVAPATLFNRIIIGPCENPIQIRAALASALTEAGVADVDQKMSMSLIPLRN